MKIAWHLSESPGRAAQLVFARGERSIPGPVLVYAAHPALQDALPLATALMDTYPLPNRSYGPFGFHASEVTTLRLTMYRQISIPRGA